MHLRQEWAFICLHSMAFLSWPDHAALLHTYTSLKGQAHKIRIIQFWMILKVFSFCPKYRLLMINGRFLFPNFMGERDLQSIRNLLEVIVLLIWCIFVQSCRNLCTSYRMFSIESKLFKPIYCMYSYQLYNSTFFLLFTSTLEWNCISVHPK